MEAGQPFVYINLQQQLDLAVLQLREAPCLAVDTESSGYYTYISEVCLIQISAGERHYIIDTLASLDLRALGELFSDSRITKVFHAAASDVRELKRCYGWVFHNIFDTFLACRMLSHRSCSLHSLVQEYEGINLQKKEQKSNWKKRPLTSSQLWYAHLDTVYLESLMKKLKRALEESSFWEEISEEFERIAAMSVSEKKVEEDVWLKLSGLQELSPLQRGRLKELYFVREKRARKDNIAAFRLANNENLLRLVRREPPVADIRALTAMRLCSPSFLKRDGAAILEALRSKNQISERELGHSVRSKRRDLETIRKLKFWRQQVAENRKIDPSMVLNNRALEQIVETSPANLEQLQQLGVMTNWKWKKYGSQILAVLGKPPVQELLNEK